MLLVLRDHGEHLAHVDFDALVVVFVIVLVPAHEMISAANLILYLTCIFLSMVSVFLVDLPLPRLFLLLSRSHLAIQVLLMIIGGVYLHDHRLIVVLVQSRALSDGIIPLIIALRILLDSRIVSPLARLAIPKTYSERIQIVGGSEHRRLLVAAWRRSTELGQPLRVLLLASFVRREQAFVGLAAPDCICGEVLLGCQADLVVGLVQGVVVAEG